jgi:hypothetical protein
VGFASKMNFLDQLRVRNSLTNKQKNMCIFYLSLFRIDTNWYVIYMVSSNFIKKIYVKYIYLSACNQRISVKKKKKKENY